MFGTILAVRRKMYIAKCKKRGLQIADDSAVRIKGLPDFGSEPYLVSIASRVYIAGNVSFITHDGGTILFRHKEGYKDVVKYGRITIHENVLVGYGSIILAGVTIGENSIVAAGSVVSSDVPPNSIVRGNPAKVVARLEDYMKYCLENTPEYNREDYKTNKREVLLKIYPYPW